MRKLTLLFIICSLHHFAIAQTIDKKSLYGKWDLHAMTSSDGYSWDNDSVAKSISNLLAIMKNEQRGQLPTAEDSIRLANTLQESFKDFSKCFIQFEKKGKCMFMLSFKKDESGYYKTYRGSYSLSENLITIKLDKSPDAIYKVELLTKTELMVRTSSAIADAAGNITTTAGTMRFKKH